MYRKSAGQKGISDRTLNQEILEWWNFKNTSKYFIRQSMHCQYTFTILA